MATNRDLLKEAIADAKAVKETAIANAKAALEEAFTPQLNAMFAAKLQEMNKEDELEEMYGKSEHEKMEEAEDMKMYEAEYMDETEKMDEIDLEELLRELEMEEGNMKDLYEAEEDDDDNMKMSGEDSDEGDEEGTPIDPEMTDEDLKDIIEDVLRDMIAAGEIEAGHEGMKDEMGKEDEEEVDLAELLREIEEMEKTDEAYSREAEEYGYFFNQPDAASKLKDVINKLKAADASGKLNDADLEAVADDVNASLTRQDVAAVQQALKEAYELNESEMIKETEEDFKAKAEAEIAQLSKKASVQKLATKIGVSALVVGAALFMYGVNAGMGQSLTAKFGQTVNIPLPAIIGGLSVIGGLITGVRSAAGKSDTESDIRVRKAELAKKERELSEAYKTIKTLKSELNEINLLNAKLLYTNKIFKAKNLNESQKVKVLSSFDKATTVGEVKLVFETLNEGIKVKPNIIKENLGRASKGTVTPNVKKPIVESNEAFLRMQKLAGII